MGSILYYTKGQYSIGAHPEAHPERTHKTIIPMHGAGTIQGRGLFCSAYGVHLTIYFLKIVCLAYKYYV